MDEARGRLLKLPHGTTSAAVTTNKNIKVSSSKSSKTFKRKRVGQTGLFLIINKVLNAFLLNLIGSLVILKLIEVLFDIF